ncbi:hypothetical protein F442_05464 [Phytophthora nicotianae P10297]|uniref:Uncharacterized protein n=3 Tax=Phytophthora nicotianae TaxID=4792 RepID=W2ZPM2_PHYNI|nr:hypothetical protein L917_05111 [Phytophthora nicotianae]ETO79957.1 hypothetical protein F444_05460 [Phytophthora nicotianae P1976]ETP48931.1 hypothetical protein F442_05464 [Phytophthora nicotianae P10297]
MLLTLRSCLLRLVVVVGATTGAILVAIAITTTRKGGVLVQEPASYWRTDDKHRLVGTGWLQNEERSLQDGHADNQPTAPFHGENRAWGSHEDREERSNGRHSDDDDDSDDHNNDGNEDNNDDDDDDEDNSRDNNDSEDDSESRSQSGKDQEAAAVQSSVVTTLDGVNIGNSITIINIGGSLANASEPGDGDDDEPNGQPSNGFALNDTDRSAITSAAVRAFCNSINCNLSNVTDTTANPLPPNYMMPPFGGGNAVRGNEAQYAFPGISSDSSVATMGRANWLLLFSTLVHLRGAVEDFPGLVMVASHTKTKRTKNMKQ